VLYPPEGRAPEAAVHFLGGAFVGAAPQLAYRPFLEALASRGVLIVATPFSTSFDHLRVADEVQYKFDRALAALGPAAGRLPVFGVGHSLGSVLHALICARYTPARAGNALMAFNNRPATDTVRRRRRRAAGAAPAGGAGRRARVRRAGSEASMPLLQPSPLRPRHLVAPQIPLLSPFIAPSARALGPLLAQLTSPGPLRATLDSATDALRGLSPGLVRQVLPLLDQLTPILMDVSQVGAGGGALWVAVCCRPLTCVAAP
jgi:hypothetical protein